MGSGQRTASEVGFPRLLVVDDSPSIHRDFREILVPKRTLHDEDFDDLEAQIFGRESKSSGLDFMSELDIDSAYQGEEAVSMVEAACAQGRPYFMAFVDIRMPPGIDGIETVKRLWRVHPRLGIVICTAYSDYTWHEIIQTLGTSPDLLILRKPFESIEVRQIVTANLARREQCALTGAPSPHATRQLVDDSTLLRVVLENVHDGVAIADRRGVIQHINPAGRAILASSSLGSEDKYPTSTEPAIPGLGDPMLERALRRWVKRQIQKDLPEGAQKGRVTSVPDTIEVWTESGQCASLELFVHSVGGSRDGDSARSAEQFVCVFRKMIGDD